MYGAAMRIRHATRKTAFGVASQCRDPFFGGVLQHRRCASARQINDATIISATNKAALRVRRHSQAGALMAFGADRVRRRLIGRHNRDAAPGARLHTWPLRPLGVGHKHMPVAQGKGSGIAVDIPADRDSGGVYRPRNPHHRHQRGSDGGRRSASSLSD